MNGDRSRSWPHVFVLTALVATMAGCGMGSAPPAKSPPSPPSSDRESPATMTEPAPASAPGAGATASPPPAAAAQPSPAPVAPPAPASEAAATMTGQVAADLKRAEHEIAAGDCPTACRALGSMEHAVVFLCAASQSAEDEDRCANARRRLTSARRRIRTTCGGCPGGPSVEPDAPIPSTPR